MEKKVLKDKIYRLLDDRSGEAFLLKVGKNRRLLVFDESKQTNRAIRHCPNEASIYIDEQSTHALVEPIIFMKGVIEVRYQDQITQKFLDAHPDNKVNNGGWFEELNEEEEAIGEVELDDLILDIKQTIRDKSKEDGGIIALEMIVSVLIDSVDRVSKMSMEEMKRILYREAEKNPDYFTDGEGNINVFDDEAMQRKYITLRAIKDGVIKKAANNKSMVWVKNNKVISSAPRGLDLVDYFADYLSTDDGMLVLEEIKRRS